MITFVEPNGMWSSFEWSPDKALRRWQHLGNSVHFLYHWERVNHINDTSLNKSNVFQFPGSLCALPLIILCLVLW